MDKGLLKTCTRCEKDLPPDAYYTSVKYSWCKKCHVGHMLLWRKTPIGRFTELKKDAKKNGFIFSLDLKDIEEMWNDPCTYCGRKVPLIALDRKDTTKAYDRKNVVVCCRWCNYSKGTGSLSFFYEQCRLVSQNMPTDMQIIGKKEDCGARYLNSWCKDSWLDRRKSNTEKK